MIDIYTTTWNDERIIQDFIDHYKEIGQCTITVYDNMSTDNTVQICKDNGCVVHQFDTDNQMDEFKLMNIRNNGWKQGTSEYVLIADSDEWVGYNLEQLDGWDICTTKGYEMFGKWCSRQELTLGCESAGYCKPVLFKRESVIETNFQGGSHKAFFQFSKIGVEQCPYSIPMFHTKWRDWDYGIGRQRLIADRVAQSNLDVQMNFHYGLEEKVHWDYFMNGIANSTKVR
jgi:glycosyltransferase involved in cell wall biosynthesis